MERELAGHAERLRNLEADVAILPDLRVAVARVEDGVAAAAAAAAGARESIGQVRTALEQRDKTASEERRSVRVALIALTGVIAAAIIGGAATVLASYAG